MTKKKMLTEDQILKACKKHTQDLKACAKEIDKALKEGRRGLPGGSSLKKLMGVAALDKKKPTKQPSKKKQKSSPSK